MPTPEEAKARAAAEEKGKAEPPPTPEPKPTPPPEPKPEPTPKPEPKKGEGAKEPSTQELQQQLSTTQGMLKQTQGELSELKKQGQNFEGLRQTIETQGQTLELITDVLGSMSEGNEELQAKVTKTRQEIEQRNEQQKKAQDTFRQMGGIAKIAGLQPDDETLKPAFDALHKGDHAGAISLTTIAVEAKVSAVGFKKPGAAPEPEPAKEDKKKLPVHSGSSAIPQVWREQSPKQKIQDGLREAREE